MVKNKIYKQTSILPSMDLMKEETKTVQISQYLHSQPERISTVLTRETKMSSIEEEDTLG